MRRKFPRASKATLVSVSKLTSGPAALLRVARSREMSLASPNSPQRMAKTFRYSIRQKKHDWHRGWVLRRLRSRLGDLQGKKIAVLGLTYTVNTDTLRRSASVELCQQLVTLGAKVIAFDPAVRNLPAELGAISLAADLSTALVGVDAVAICTEWPQFRLADWGNDGFANAPAGFCGRKSFS